MSGWDLATVGSKASSIATPALLQLLYELNLHFNGAFHNIWQFKPVNMSTVEVGGASQVSPGGTIPLVLEVKKKSGKMDSSWHGRIHTVHRAVFAMARHKSLKEK